MDRDRVDAQLRNLERLVDDPPPLLTLVVLANGLGLAHSHTLMRKVEAGTLDELVGALRLIQVCLDDFLENLEDQLAAIDSVLLDGQDREITNVVESL